MPRAIVCVSANFITHTGAGLDPVWVRRSLIQAALRSDFVCVFPFVGKLECAIKKEKREYSQIPLAEQSEIVKSGRRRLSSMLGEECGRAGAALRLWEVDTPKSVVFAAPKMTTDFCDHRAFDVVVPVCDSSSMTSETVGALLAHSTGARTVVFVKSLHALGAFAEGSARLLARQKEFERSLRQMKELATYVRGTKVWVSRASIGVVEGIIQGNTDYSPREAVRVA